MARPLTSQKPTKAAEQASKPAVSGKTLKEQIEQQQSSGEVEYTFLTLYLTTYNWISAILWVAILGRVSLTLSTEGHEHVQPQIGELLKWTQSLAVLEVMHSSFGVVRANFMATLIQVLSRLVMVWIVVYQFPEVAINSVAFSTMVLAWSLTESIRYSYFTGMAAYGQVPSYLRWLRYSTFIVLYPIGILSEVWLIVLATQPAKKSNPWFERGAYAILALYAPGSWLLYVHMIKQRRKVMSTPNKTKTK